MQFLPNSWWKQESKYYSIFQIIDVVPMVKTYDYIIVGAGVIGCATAYYMQKNNPNARILLLENTALWGVLSCSKLKNSKRTILVSWSFRKVFRSC